MKAVGQHALLDVFDCSADLLRDAAALETILRSAAADVGATVLGGHFHTFAGAGGVTGVLLLAESHISIHTWPEYALAAVDVFLCGTSVAVDAVCATLARDLGAARWDCVVHERGQAT